MGNPFAEMLAGMSDGDEGPMFDFMDSEQLAKLRASFVHIPDLKPGDKVRWKGPGYKIQKMPELGQVVEVFRVGVKGSAGEAGGIYENQEKDFSILVRDRDGDYVEYSFDSRRFERVAE